MKKSQEFLEFVAKSLVSDPSAVFVESKTDEMGVLLTLHVAPQDVGKLIGRKGVMANSLRTVLRGVGMSENARVNMKIAEPEGRENREY